MITKLKVKKIKGINQRKIIVWIRKRKEYNDDILQIFQFFKDNLETSKKSRFCRYFKITSKNPAIMLSLTSAIHDLIPDLYFKEDNYAINLDNFI